MAESMSGMKRSHRCTEVSSANIGENVTVMGWVQKSRNKGGIIFVDLRDRSGILQIIFEESDCGQENFEKAEKLRSEFVIAVEGRVEARSGGVNENLATGAIADFIGVRHPALPHRGKQQDQGRTAAEIPLSGSAQAGYPEKSHDQEPGGYPDESIFGRRGLPGDRDPDAD